MIQKPRFSLLISVYNSQAYLKACIDSCIQQTFQNIEILCVDDCSTDDSLSLLHEYREKDPRVRVFAHTENKRQGGARNTALAQAAGEYCWIIDSDDILSRTACEYADKKIAETDTDILWFNHDAFYDTTENPVFIPAPEETPFCKSEILISTKHLTKSPAVQPWHYIIRKEVLQGISFRENVYHEDVDFTYKAFYSAHTLYCAPVILYHYRIRNGSDTHSVYTATKLKNQIEACISLYTFICKNRIKRTNFLCKFTHGYSEYLQNMIETQYPQFNLEGSYLLLLKKIEKKTQQKALLRFTKKLIAKSGL